MKMQIYFFWGVGVDVMVLPIDIPSRYLTVTANYDLEQELHLSEVRFPLPTLWVTGRCNSIQNGSGICDLLLNAYFLFDECR